MTIKKDINRICNSLLEIAPITKKRVVVTIYSKNYTSRHPNSIYYQNKQSILTMIDNKWLKLIASGENGTPALDNSSIHYFTYFEVEFSPQKIEECVREEKTNIDDHKIKTHKQQEVYIWRGLVLNTQGATLQYDNGPVKNISPETREMKFLWIIMKNGNNTVPYLTIAKEIGVVGNSTKLIAQDIHIIKRDLINDYLTPLHMPKKEIGLMLVNVRNLGYRLGQNSSS